LPPLDSPSGMKERTSPKNMGNFSEILSSADDPANKRKSVQNLEL